MANIKDIFFFVKWKNSMEIASCLFHWIIIVAFETSFKLRVGGRRSLRALVRVVAFEAFPVRSDPGMKIRIRFDGRAMEPDIMSIGTANERSGKKYQKKPQY
jgi:hypothetical protein